MRWLHFSSFLANKTNIKTPLPWLSHKYPRIAPNRMAKHEEKYILLLSIEMNSLCLIRFTLRGANIATAVTSNFWNIRYELSNIGVRDNKNEMKWSPSIDFNFLIKQIKLLFLFLLPLLAGSSSGWSFIRWSTWAIWVLSMRCTSRVMLLNGKWEASHATYIKRIEQKQLKSNITEWWCQFMNSFTHTRVEYKKKILKRISHSKNCVASPL